LVPFGAAEPLADALIELLVKPEALADAREAARRAGASLSWPEVGRQTAAVLREAIEGQHRRRGPLSAGLRAGGRLQPCFVTRSKCNSAVVVRPVGGRASARIARPTPSCARRPRTCAEIGIA